MKLAHLVLGFTLFALTCSLTYAITPMERCLLEKMGEENNAELVESLRALCERQIAETFVPERVLQEQATQDSDFVITPYRQNYILPYSYNDKPNQDPFLFANTFPDNVKPVRAQEAKLQISFKVPLHYDDLLFKNDGLYFGFSLKSFWQLYNEAASRPFRETNYRPEVFYQVPLPIHAWKGSFFGRIGFEHESNGRSQFLSRSWNRAYVGLGFVRRNWVIYLQPWYRIPENDKEDDGDPLTPPDPNGDDNPDIHKFLGHYELTAVWKHNDTEVSTLLRQNFNTGNGGVEMGVSFPMWGRLKGFVQYYNGYGESLIDYDHHVNRISVGFLLTDLL